MKVILTDMVDKLGKAGDIVDVKKGYARNYLLPKNLAMPATKGTEKMIEMLKIQRIKKALKSKEEANELLGLLEGKNVTAKVKASEQEKLYGSVSERDIVSLLMEQHNIKLDHNNIHMDEHLKRLGSYSVKIILNKDTEFVLPVYVVRKEDN